MELDNSKPIVIYESMKKFINNIKKTESKTTNTYKEYFLNNKTLEEFNKKITNENYWGVDKYGIVIRFKEFNKMKNIHGWTVNENDEIISTMVDKQLINCEDINIRENAISKIIQLNPNITKSTKTTVYKIYTKLGVKLQ